ncbi:TrmH family RNA methyltransferase [Pendulispora albinea]|uniref:RNA methyltransferase n=1 Tax=Pendulispora albinea TaxID=2741071 RepID=A0ABZ2LZD9_9BACT
MRRRSLGVLNKEELVSERILRVEKLDPAGVVRVLEPFVNDRRRARLLDVIGQRIGSIAVLFESPHDPHNGAAVLRTCEAFGIQRLHVIESREAFLAAASVARGAEKWVDIVPHRTVEGALDAAKTADLELIATHPQGELAPEDLARIPRFALVLGNERDGISARLTAACPRAVRVPMRGFVESLNVSVTAAILLAGATHGRPGDLDEAARLRLYARGLYLSTSHADDLLAQAGFSV